MSNDSMLIEPDFSQTQDQVEPGIYKARIVDAKLDMWEGRDGKPSTRYIAWTMETFDEPEEKNNGRRIFHRTPIEGKGAFRLKSFFKAAMREEIGSTFDPTMLFSREIEVTVAPQKDQPEYNEVKIVKAIV